MVIEVYQCLRTLERERCLRHLQSPPLTRQRQNVKAASFEFTRKFDKVLDTTPRQSEGDHVNTEFDTRRANPPRRLKREREAARRPCYRFVSIRLYAVDAEIDACQPEASELLQGSYGERLRTRVDQRSARRIEDDSPCLCAGSEDKRLKLGMLERLAAGQVDLLKKSVTLKEGRHRMDTHQVASMRRGAGAAVDALERTPRGHLDAERVEMLDGGPHVSNHTQRTRFDEAE